MAEKRRAHLGKVALLAALGVLAVMAWHAGRYQQHGNKLMEDYHGS